MDSQMMAEALLNQKPYIVLMELSWDNIHLQLAVVVGVCGEELLRALHVVGKFSLCEVCSKGL